MCRQLREFNPRRSEPPSFPPLSRNRQITWPRGGISVAVSPPPGFARRQVRLGDIGVQLDSVAGLVLNGEIAVLPEWALAHHKVRPPVHPVGQLVEAEFAHGGGSVARRDPAGFPALEPWACRGSPGGSRRCGTDRWWRGTRGRRWCSSEWPDSRR